MFDFSSHNKERNLGLKDSLAEQGSLFQCLTENDESIRSSVALAEPNISAPFEEILFDERVLRIERESLNLL